MLWELKKIWYRIYQRVFKVAMCFMDWSEPQLLEGAGSILKLPEFIKSKGVNKVLVVTDKGLMSLNLLDPLFKKLEEVGVEYVVYDGVQPNPTIPNIEECKDMYVQNNCQGIIAFGGGSSMDCAKAAGARVRLNTVINNVLYSNLKFIRHFRRSSLFLQQQVQVRKQL